MQLEDHSDIVEHFNLKTQNGKEDIQTIMDSLNIEALILQKSKLLFSTNIPDLKNSTMD